MEDDKPSIYKVWSSAREVEGIGSRYLESVAALENSLKDFVKLDFGMEDDKKPLLELLAQEVSFQRRNFEERLAFLSEITRTITPVLEHFGVCVICGETLHDTYIRKAPHPYEGKQICDGCYDSEFFDCHSCKKILPMSEAGEEDAVKGYGWYCKECSKPMEFPQEMLLFPEHCEEMAFSDMRALAAWYTGSFPLEERDGIKIHFVRPTSERSALYESDSGRRYEIDELDCFGCGRMEEIGNEEGERHLSP